MRPTPATYLRVKRVRWSLRQPENRRQIRIRGRSGHFLSKMTTLTADYICSTKRKQSHEIVRIDHLSSQVIDAPTSIHYLSHNCGGLWISLRSPGPVPLQPTGRKLVRKYGPI